MLEFLINRSITPCRAFRNPLLYSSLRSARVFVSFCSSSMLQCCGDRNFREVAPDIAWCGPCTHIVGEFAATLLSHECSYVKDYDEYS